MSAGQQGAAPRRALVTGASSGIGEATARALARAGYRVALLARREAELERVRASLADPQAHLCVPCDLRDATSVAAALNQVRAHMGALDLVVQNAAHGYLARVEEYEPALLRSLVATNVTAVLDVARESLPLLRVGERPVMVLVSSIVARRGIPGQVAYAASKAALNSIGEGLRIEWAGDGIAVCLLDVGLTRTAFFANQPNPARLRGPDVGAADSPERVADEIVALDAHPEPERWLSWKWRALSLLGLLSPRLSDRYLVRRMGGGWSTPGR
ncbi:MAG: SDR family oxidoreductase [Planctomycetes bacterium]|nr:SDR family oxidoreductase [Planctomycetota bacterium]